MRVADPERTSLPPVTADGVPTRIEPRSLYVVVFAIAAANLICLALLWPTRVVIDYRAFYSAGHIARFSPALVYDIAEQKRVQLLLPQMRGWLPFYHPPIELLVFAPLSALPYRSSLAAWMLLSVAALLLSTWLLASLAGTRWWQLALISLAMFPFCHAFYEGQDTFLLLLALTAALWFASRQRETLAGVVLAVGLFKPQIPIVVALALLLQGHRKLFGAFCACAAAIALVSYTWMGRTGLWQMQTLIHYQEPLDKTWGMPSIRGLLSLVNVPNSASIAVCIVLLGIFAVRWYRAERQLVPIFSSAVLVGSLTAFHLQSYDLAVLLIPIALLWAKRLDWLQFAALFAICACLIYLPLAAMESTALLAIPVLLLTFYPGQFSSKSD